MRLKAERDVLQSAARNLDEAAANVSGALNRNNWTIVEKCITLALEELCQGAYPVEKLLAQARQNQINRG